MKNEQNKKIKKKSKKKFPREKIPTFQVKKN